MRCEEIQEKFIDLLYDERGTPKAGPELHAHIASCPTCRMELEKLRSVRRELRSWEDESIPRPVQIPVVVKSRRASGFALWPVLRYAGIVALVVLCFVSLTNAEISWTNRGFSFKTHGLFGRASVGDYYTKAEVRDLLKKVLDDSESRMTDVNYLMIQRMMETVEQEHLQELRYVRSSAIRDGGRN